MVFSLLAVEFSQDFSMGQPLSVSKIVLWKKWLLQIHCQFEKRSHWRLRKFVKSVWENYWKEPSALYIQVNRFLLSLRVTWLDLSWRRQISCIAMYWRRLQKRKTLLVKEFQYLRSSKKERNWNLRFCVSMHGRLFWCYCYKKRHLPQNWMKFVCRYMGTEVRLKSDIFVVAGNEHVDAI